MPQFVRLLIAAVLGALPGCTHDQKRSEPCPIGGILEDAETATAFDGAGQGPGNVVQRATITNVSLKCSYHGARVVNASLSFDIAVERGPAGRTGAVTVPYFVAVSRGGSAILAREAYSRTFALDKGPRESAREEIGRVSIPIAPKASGASYEVIVGLVVTPDQLAFNRARHTHN